MIKDHICYTLSKWRNLEESILMEKDLLSNDFSLYTILQGKIHYEKHSHLNNRRGFVLEDTSSEFYNYKPFNQTYNLIFLTLVRCLSHIITIT